MGEREDWELTPGNSTNGDGVKGTLLGEDLGNELFSLLLVYDLDDATRKLALREYFWVKNIQKEQSWP